MLQADGRRDLEQNNNPGDEDDLFDATAGVALSHDMNPASVLWDRSESGLTISDIGAPSVEIAVTVGEGDHPMFSVAENNPVEAARLAETLLRPSEILRMRADGPGAPTADKSKSKKPSLNPSPALRRPSKSL